jgi:hypothetical protein
VTFPHTGPRQSGRGRPAPTRLGRAAARLERQRLDRPAGEEWQPEVERAQEQLVELAEMWAEREITRGEWVSARAPIENRLDTAKRLLAAINRTTELTPHLGNAKELREQWETMTLTRQKQIVAALLQHVVVGPGRRGYNRFDPARLTPTAPAARPYRAGAPATPGHPVRATSPSDGVPRPARDDKAAGTGRCTWTLAHEAMLLPTFLMCSRQTRDLQFANADRLHSAAFSIGSDRCHAPSTRSCCRVARLCYCTRGWRSPHRTC